MKIATVIGSCILLVVTAVSSPAVEPPAVPFSQAKNLWQQFKAGFVQDDGRVVDRQQNGISHSESQGYGMLASVFYDDRQSFDAIWRWTRDNLQARKDGLLCWSWGERANGRYGILDYNNATDGDILVAYALIMGDRKWHEAQYRSQGQKIIEAIRKNLAVSRDGQTFLMPGYFGFLKNEDAVLNPSYMIFPAYRAFSEVDDKPFWETVYRDSRDLAGACLSGKLKLPPDWVVLRQKRVALWEERSPVFGNEAIRTLLNLSWERDPRFPEGVTALFDFFAKTGYLPATVDLAKNQVSLEEAPAGFYGTFARAAEKLGRNELSRLLWRKALEKAEYENNYFSTILLLLALHSDEP